MTTVEAGAWRTPTRAVRGFFDFFCLLAVSDLLTDGERTTCRGDRACALAELELANSAKVPTARIRRIIIGPYSI